MDIVTVLIIAGLVILCLLPLMSGLSKYFDRRANGVEGKDPETERALREVRRDINKGQGWNWPS